MGQFFIVLILSLGLVACQPEQEHGHAEACSNVVTGPLGIVIGDSIAEGHPALHGRHHGQCESLQGQTSYYLERQFEMPVLNQGIGGQTCAEVLARWDADVTSNSPEFVWLNCGQNDLIKERDPIASIKANVLLAVEHADRGGYRLMIQNLGYHHADASLNGRIVEINAWLATLQSETVTVVDFHAWSASNAALIPDGLHPSRQGYEAFAQSYFFSM